MAGSVTQIDQLSVHSLYIEMLFNGTNLGSASGFVAQRGDRFFLITNYHVISGRHAETGEIRHRMGAVPNTARVWHQETGKLGAWLPVDYPTLNFDNSPRWISHPTIKAADVIALEISRNPDARYEFHPLDISLADADLLLAPSDRVSIIGFPFGISSSGRLPIWKTGHIASDLDVDYANKPIFLVDITTKEGMSGSPVFAKRFGTYASRTGTTMVGGIIKFLGVYSSRIPDAQDSPKESNLGMVWKDRVVKDILDSKM